MDIQLKTWIKLFELGQVDYRSSAIDMAIAFPAGGTISVTLTSHQSWRRC